MIPCAIRVTERCDRLLMTVQRILFERQPISASISSLLTQSDDLRAPAGRPHGACARLERSSRPWRLPCVPPIW